MQVHTEQVDAGNEITPPDVNPIPCGALLAGWTDAENGVYVDGTSTLYAGEKPSIKVTENKTFYAVFADLEGAVPEMPTVIAYWENQALAKNNGVDATIGTGTMTSNIALSSANDRTYFNSNLNSTTPTLTLSNLNLSSHTNVSLSFWARASQQSTITIKSNISNDVIATITTTKEEKLYVINDIPASATSITLTYGYNVGSFYFGSVKLYSAATYSFEKLTAENTNGWSGNDWNGYYLITNDQNSLRALDGNGINEDCHFSVIDNDGIIEYSIASAFQVEFLADKGYCVKGVGDGLYLGVGDNSGSPSANPIYHESIGYNSLYNSVSPPTSVLSWNNSGSKFGFYGSIMTSASQMYKIMSELSNYRTLCTYDIVLKNNYVDDDSKDGLATITATKTTFNTFTPPTQRPGYIIEGYYAEPQCTKKVVEANQTLITNVDGYTQNGQWIGGNVELYTKWQPLIYNLQSGDFFDWGTCSGGNLTLDGSAIGVKYQLYKDDVKYGEEISGTGEALIWEITESGNYTVKSVDPEMLMNGKAVVQLQDPTIVGENTVEVGKTIELTHPGHRDAAGSWVSSNPEIARVDNNTVTGVAAGIVTITFHGLGNCDATHEVTIVNPEYTMTWKIDEGDYATTTVQAGKTIAALPTNPADNALGCCSDKFMGWTTSIAQTINKADVFTTLAEAQAKFPNITEDKTFRAVFATAAQGVGTSIADFSEMGYENATAVTAPIFLGDGEGRGDATITLAKAPSSKNDAKYYDDGEAVRIYAGGTITIASTYNNATIKNIIFTFAGNDVVGENTITANSGTYDNGTWTGDASTVTFTIAGSTGHRRIASITVTTGVAGSQYTNYVTQCELSGEAAIGEGTVAYANEGTAIAVNCGNLSPKNTAATLTFPSAKNLTCPVTLTASEGFVLSTNKQSDTYQSKITIKPIKSGDNTGKLKNVYVRAIAPAMFSGEKNGTITVSGGEIATPFTVDIAAEVSCNTYTITLIDHLGNTIGTPTSHYEGDIIELPTELKEDACSENYTFDGWSTAPVEYGSLIYNKVTFPFTMPAENVTLIPVYRLLEDISKADYHRVTSDLGANNWAGDYLIAASSQIFANGSTGGTDDVNCIGGVGSAVNPEDNLIDDLVKYAWGDVFNVTLVKVDGGYVLQTGDKKYNYLTNGATSAGLSVNEDIKYASINNNPLTVTFNNEKDIVITNPVNTNGFALKYSSQTSNFRFLKSGTSIYLYKKSPLYTSSLICEEVTVSDALVTSTAGQTVKVNVPITLTSSLDRTTDITAESDNPHFTITNLSGIEEGNHTLAVHYRPTATTDGTETANIKIKVNNLPVNTFQVTGRHLPENFVIAAKWGDNWYAMPANMDSQSSTEGWLIEVDNSSDPIKATAAPNTTKYRLKSVYTSNSSADRFANYGERFVFVENVTGNSKTLYNGGTTTNKTNIQVYAQYTNYYEDNEQAPRYEWTPTTTNLKDYILTSAITLSGDASARTISLDNYGVYGTLLQNKAYNGQVRLLPVENFYEPAVLQVVEWKAKGLSIMYTGVGTKYTTKVGNNSESEVQILSDNKIDHAVYALSTGDLTAATNKPLVVTIKDEEDAIVGAIKLTIPAIVTGVKNSTSLVTSEVANATDVIVLSDATLNADGTKYTYNDIVVYPGGKLVIGQGGQLGMYTLTLRAGSSWGAVKYEHKYPEFVLNTTTYAAYSNTSGKINLDYVTTKEQYYTFVAPFAVNTKDIKYPVDIYGSTVAANNTGSYEFQYYDGAARAAGNTGWMVVNEDPNDDGEYEGATLIAGQGYTFLGMPKKINGTRQTFGIHRIPMSVAAGIAMTHENSEQSITVAPHPSEKNNNSGWNLIGNPYMSTIGGLTNEDIQVGKLVHTNDANGNWTGGWHWDDPTNGQRFLVIPSNDGQSYEAVQASNATLPAFKNFFVQISNEGANALSIPRTTPAAQLLAPARRTEEVVKDVEVAIVLEQDEQYADQMDFLFNNIYTEEFERDADFTKMMNATNLNLYGVHPYDNLSFVAIDNNTARGSVAIGYQVPQAGEYTLRMSDKPYVMFDKIEALYVTDHEISPEVTTDIMSEPYRFTVANAETNHTRFTVSVILKTEEVEDGEDDGGGDLTTGVDNTTNNNRPHKFIYQDKMYILLNGVIYDAMGKQVQTINK